MSRVEFQVQFQHVDAWLTEKTQLTALRVLFHKNAQIVLIHPTLPGYAGDLKLRRCQRNVRVEAGA
jgi:hypothetical protein